MNFLGHLLLTYPHRGLTMGNLLGDFVRSREAKSLDPVLQQGIGIHHEIDRFTDTHPEVRRLINMLRSTHGRYSPVVVDILFDHVLAREWHQHAPISYRVFTNWVYDVVQEFLPEIFDPVSDHLESMARHRWIDGYDTREKVYQVLLRMDRRASFPSTFVSGINDITQHYETFVTAFSTFYSEIKEMPSLKMALRGARGSSL